MLKLIGFEIFKMSRRPRTYLGFAVSLLISICVMLGLKYGHLEMVSTHNMNRQGFGLVGSPINAEFMSWMVVGSPLAFPILTMVMPFYICLVFGEIFGGEMAEGTLRPVLARPVRRTTFFVSKFIAGLIYGLCQGYFLGISAYIIGLIFFGRGGLMATGTFEHPALAWYAEAPGLARLAFGYLLMCAGAVTVGMIAFFISSWLNNSLGALGGSLMLLFSCLVIGEIPWFKPIKNYLFTTHLFAGQNAFLDPIPWHDVKFAVECLGVYVIVLFLISLLIFRRKDVLA